MIRRPPFKAAAAIASLMLIASPAMAHPGHGEGGGLLGGLLHPFTGLDHLVAMLLVGVWAFRLPIAQRWRAPAVFLVAMVAGFGAARAGLSLPAEAVIAVSLAGLPVLALLAPRLPLAAQFGGVALFGLAHGFAHGAEIEGTAGAFFAGMMVASAALHAIGFVGAARLQRFLPALQR